MPAEIAIPRELLPADGRFGSGPSKVRQEAVDRLREVAPQLLGTSHRRPAVKGQVRRVRDGLRAFFGLPDDYEVVLGVGGATLFWEVAAFSLVRERSAHAVFGEFSSKFAAVTRIVGHLAEPVTVESPYGTHPPLAELGAAGRAAGVDLYGLTHSETSTGVVMPIARPADDGALVAVDATSAAGGVGFDPTACDAYYFSPQKGFASEGGLWVALLSPAAIARAEEIAGSGRGIPPMLSLTTAIDNSRKDQTYSTPAIATLFLMGEQIDWMNARGGFDWAAKSCAEKAAHVYDWAEASDFATPFVRDPSQRSPVVCTIDFDETVSADELAKVLRANGIVDTEAYRKLGRNQLRIAVFPAIDPADVEALTACIDYVVERLAA